MQKEKCKEQHERTSMKNNAKRNGIRNGKVKNNRGEV
jgi:hypothetical protein